MRILLLSVLFFISTTTLSFSADIDANIDNGVVKDEKITPGMWSSEDCIRISRASGFYLKISGDLLKDSGEKREDGDNRRADELGAASLFFSDQAANYATNFQAYCHK